MVTHMCRTGLAILASVTALMAGCSQRPAECFVVSPTRDQERLIRQIAATISSKRDMFLADRSFDGDAATSDHLTLNFQLVGGGTAGRVSARLLGAPFWGTDVQGWHSPGRRGWVCFYGDADNEELRALVSDFANELKNASIDHQSGLPE